MGLHAANFRPLAFSEINPDAAKTFATNIGIGARQFGDVNSMSPKVLRELREEWEGAGKWLDLVCGGPPCQGYSGIGHRRSYQVEKEEIPSNYLFMQMVRVIKTLQPRAFLFENVRGLVSGKWTAGGRKGEIWEDVRTTFRGLRGYQVGWRLVQAKDFGVPQNRPRILLVGVRTDLGIAIETDRPNDPLCNPRGLIPEGRVTPPDLIDALGDLDDDKFAEKQATTRYLVPPKGPFQHAMRKRPDGTIMAMNDPLEEQVYTKHSERVTQKFEYMHANKGLIHHTMQTKKFAQRLLPPRWDAEGPTITATSLPDDFVHYSRPRILTVREWARLQMFPDWYEFHGPRTTGGLRRAGVPTQGIWDREVPKYTQIGNAVPVGLAAAVGKHLAGLLLSVG